MVYNTKYKYKNVVHKNGGGVTRTLQANLKENVMSTSFGITKGINGHIGGGSSSIGGLGDVISGGQDGI